MGIWIFVKDFTIHYCAKYYLITFHLFSKSCDELHPYISKLLRVDPFRPFLFLFWFFDNSERKASKLLFKASVPIFHVYQNESKKNTTTHLAGIHDRILFMCMPSPYNKEFITQFFGRDCCDIFVCSVYKLLTTGAALVLLRYIYNKHYISRPPCCFIKRDLKRT